MMSKRKPTPHGAKSANYKAGQFSTTWYGAAFAGLFLATLLWHGLLLTNDGTIWDSWYVLSWLQNKNWRALHEFFDSVGMPVYGWLYRPFAFAPDIVGAFMMATFLCLVAQSFCTHLIARRLGGLSSVEALCLTLLAQAMPIFTAGQDFIMFFFVAMHTLFLLGALLASFAIDSVGTKHYVLRIFSLGLFLISFYNAALLVFYGGFFLLLFFQYRRVHPLPFWRGTWMFIRCRWDFLLLPPVAWILRHRLTPQFGWYEFYNSPLENIPVIIPSLLSFLQNVVPFHLMQLSRWLLGNPSLVMVLIIGMVGWAMLAPPTWAVKRGRTSTPLLLAFGLLLLFLAIFPFAAAGKIYSPVPMGEPSRYTILTGVPLAILLYGAMRLAFMRGAESSSRLIIPFTAAAVIVLGCQIPPAYIAERAEWVFSRSVLANAIKNDEIKKSSIIVLQNFGMTGQIIYGIYSFASAFGEPSRLVTSQVPQNRQYFMPSELAMTLLGTTVLPNELKKINPAGQQTLVVANRNRGDLTDWQITKDYLALRYFGTAAQREAFLGGLTTLQTTVLKPESKLVPGPAVSDSLPTETPHANAPFTNTVGMEMIPISGGWWASRFETTQGQFEKLMNNNPSLFKDPSRPVERVSWTEAVEFCRRLTESENQLKKLPEGYEYRLPTVKEFEVLAGDVSPFDAVTAGREPYWSTQPVGSTSPNRLGLNDVVGNVWEWTDDWADKAHRMKHSFGGGWENAIAELSPYSGGKDQMDSHSRTFVARLFGPLRRDYPDQAFWDRGFRCVLATRVRNQNP